MAAPTPTAIFGPGFVLDTVNDTITFKYASNVDPVHDFVMLDAADANTTDARAIIYGILARVMAWQTATAVLDRPETMRLTSGGSLVTVGEDTYLQRNFNVVFQADLTALQLLPEV